MGSVLDTGQPGVHEVNQCLTKSRIPYPGLGVRLENLIFGADRCIRGSLRLGDPEGEGQENSLYLFDIAK